MRRTLPVLVPTILLAVVGANVSYNLLSKHLTKKTGLDWFDSVCDGDDDPDNKVSCDEVLSSDYGVFPPKRADDPEGKFRVPVALLGLFYFSALSVWYICVGRPDHARRLYHLFPLLLTLAGVCSSVFFMYIMFTGLDFWCPWCLVTHVINFLLLVGVVLLWPRRKMKVVPVQSAADAATAPEASQAPPAAAESSHSVFPEVTERPLDPADLPPVHLQHPTRRLAWVTLATILAVSAAEFYLASAGTLRAQMESQKSQIQSALKEVAKGMWGLYQTEQKRDLRIRPDDPIRHVATGGELQTSLVVFSDFRCPHCARFARTLEEERLPLFAGHVRVIFKYYPIEKACNKHITRDLHPGACRAARAVEAARVLGGSDAFWKAHDRLFGLLAEQTKFDYRALAVEWGFDPDEFVQTMDSEAVGIRIQEDVELAKAVGVDATPAVFLAGRRVPRIAVSETAFWQQAASSLERNIAQIKAQQAKTRQQASTQPAQTSAGPAGANRQVPKPDKPGAESTPDNPGP
ncbi:MAG TPA: vitamin K epoxide reductase family protein [Phycisphaerae bacterium]|nr:vitamin K epoxide reductase family protein [Phycisphaerae bacterium]